MNKDYLEAYMTNINLSGSLICLAVISYLIYYTDLMNLHAEYVTDDHEEVLRYGRMFLKFQMI